ncbi:hypothetical protein [Halorubrum sp. Hd13]|uniref:hypothetical protein n=1 Tax=Halorubrum sp. Hd13 TaxID=1480728 RepID=UPI0011401883|nr:hypothetical protein [Halorubrum sp. Hd13]
MVDHLYPGGAAPSDDPDLPPPWKRVEDYLIRELHLEEDHSSWHDARDADGEAIEIKSCAAKHADGNLGKFKIWQYQLLELIGEGRVALVVYAHNDRRSVMALRLVDPIELLRTGRASWVNHSTMGVRLLRQIQWTDVIPLKEVAIGARHHFAKHYPEEEAEEVFFLCESDEQIRFY